MRHEKGAGEATVGLLYIGPKADLDKFKKRLEDEAKARGLDIETVTEDA